MIYPGDRILLSLSAGKDSMLMLDLIIRYRDNKNIYPGIFHLNHLMRGEESDMDEMLVKNKSLRYGIPFYGRSFDFNAGIRSRLSFEEEARGVRYKMLHEIASAEGYNKIATAHNRRDNSETMLMRIFSGTGIFGLKGISYTNGNIIRPILDLYPEEIYSYLKKNNIEWREDRTNTDNQYLRNYIRNKILPVVKERFPDSEENITTLSSNAVENESLLSFLTEKLNPHWLVETEGGYLISMEPYSDNISYMKYLLSRALYSKYGMKLTSSIYNEIVRRYTIDKSNLILYEKNRIIIIKKFINNKKYIFISDILNENPLHDFWEYEIMVRNEGSIYIEELKKYINYRESCFEEFNLLKSDKNNIFLSIPSNMENIKIRNRRDGDRITLEQGIKKIKELMIEKKLDINTKKSVPLIVINNEIAAYLPGAVVSCPDRVSCNFWINDCSDRILIFNFSDPLDSKDKNKENQLFRSNK